MKSLIKVALAATSIATMLLLGACASAGESVQPAASRDAHLPGSRMCVNNNSTMKMRILWRGYPDTRPILPAGQSCNSGYEAIDENIAATLEYEPLDAPGTWLQWKFTVDNSWPSYPHVMMWFVCTNNFRCGIELYSKVAGDTSAMQKSGLRADVFRLADSDSSKEWEVSLTPASGDDFWPWESRRAY